MRRSRRRGVALIAVLWIGALAAILLVGVRLSAAVDLSLSHAELEVVQARWLARAGVDQAMAVLADDGLEVDSTKDKWYRDAGYFENVELATGTFAVTAPPGESDADTAVRFGVTDLAGLLNVNAADNAQLQRLEDVTAPLAASILDWRDGNSDTRTGGAERGYYAKLDFPYVPRNKPFATRHELRLVKDVDDDLFFGEDLDLDGVLDPNENDRDASPPDDDGNGELRRGLGGLMTVYGYELNQTGAGLPRVNLAEASEAVLKSRLKLSSPLAKGVVDARGRNRFDTVFDLLDVQPDRNTSTEGDPSDAVQSIDLEWIGEHLDDLTLEDDERLPAKVNINTAPREVLLTLQQLDDDEADAILRHRESDAGPFDTVGELREAGGLDDGTFRAVAEKVVVRSHVFQVDATGTTARGLRRRVIAVVDRGASPMKVLYWHEGL